MIARWIHALLDVLERRQRRRRRSDLAARLRALRAHAAFRRLRVRPRRGFEVIVR